jgi:hypothetical protein
MIIMIIILIIFLFSLLLINNIVEPLVRCMAEQYCKTTDPDEYDYDRENPNALVKGENIAGTVFSLESDNVPGQGWIL